MIKTNPEDAEFHANRRMFVIVDDYEIIYAPIGTTMSHSEWFLSEHWTTEKNLPNFLNTYVRGFYDEVSDNLYFYVGDGFYFNTKTYYTVIDNIKLFLLEPTLNTSRHTLVILGPKDQIVKGVRYSKMRLGFIGKWV